MKWLIIFIVLLAFVATPVYAETIEYCINDTYSQKNKTVTVEFDGNSTLIESFKTTYCNNGCSDTLGECRFDAFMEAIVIVLVVSLLVGFIYLSREIAILNVSIIIVGSLASVLIAITDVFNTPINTLFLILPLGILTYGIWVWWHSKKEDEFGMEYD